MREILFRGKDAKTGDWYFGYVQKKYVIGGINWLLHEDSKVSAVYHRPIIVDPETIGRFTGLTDKNGVKIFEGDIVEYLTYDGFDCQAVVKIGAYKQDGSGGEYDPVPCYGVYAEVDNYTCPDWCDNEPQRYGDYRWTVNLPGICKCCEVIGNIYDNPELLEVKDNVD